MEETRKKVNIAQLMQLQSGGAAVTCALPTDQIVIDGRFGGFNAGPASQFGPALLSFLGRRNFRNLKKVNITSQKDGQSPLRAIFTNF